MANISNSLAVIGASALVSGQSADLPLALRIEGALSDIQTLEGCRSQWGDRIDQPAYREAASRVIESLGALPELVPADQVNQARQLLGGATPAKAVEGLVSLLTPLSAEMERAQVREEESVRERLLTMNQIVSGGQPLAGLPDIRSLPKLYPAFPEWARALRYRSSGDGKPAEERAFQLGPQGHGTLSYGRQRGQVDITFQHGSFWIGDRRDTSLLDIRNWTYRWVGGVYVGVDAGLRLRAGVRWPVKPGEKVRLGKKSAVELLLPRTPILEGLKGKILAAKSLEDLSKLLRDGGVSEISDQIDRYLQSGGNFDTVPPEGGLALKIHELVLRREFSRVHERYLPGLPEEIGMQMLGSLAMAIQDAASAAELKAAVTASMVPGTTVLARGVVAFFSKKAKASLNDIPEEFGLRDRVLLFSSQADKELRTQASRLEREVRGLSKELQGTQAALEAKIVSLEAAEKSGRELSARFQAAKEEWQKSYEKNRKEWELLAQRLEVEAKRGQVRIRELEATESMLEGARKGLESSLAEVNQRLAENQSENEELMGENLLQGTQLSEAQEAFEAKERELAELRESLERQLGETKATLKETQDERTEWKGTATRLTGELEEAARQFAAKEEALVATQGRLTTIEENRNASLRELTLARVELERKGQEIERLNADIARLERDVSERREELKELNKELGQLRASKASLDARVAELDGAERRARIARASEKEVLDQNAQFEFQRDEAREKLERTEQDLATIKAERDAKAAEIGELNEQITGLKEEIESINKGWAEVLRAEEAERTKVQGQLTEASRAAGMAEELKAQIAERDDRIELLADQLETARNRVTEGDVALEIAEGNLRQTEERLQKLDLVREQLVVRELGIKEHAGKTLAESAARQRGLETRISQLEGEIEEWTAARSQSLSEVEGARVELAASKRRLSGLETDLELTRGEVERLRAVEVELGQVKQSLAQREIELAQHEKTGEIDLSSASYAGILDRFFGMTDPRLEMVEISIQEEVPILDDVGNGIGRAHITAGNQSGSYSHQFQDGSLASGATSQGGRRYQEDGFYVAGFHLPDGTEVKVLSGADGAGGMGGGDVASSSFLQGVHARVAEAAAEGRAPTAGELFLEGYRAVGMQKKQPTRPNAKNATGAGAVIVIVGDTATIATAGDAMVVFAQRQADGTYRTEGYSNADHMDLPSQKAITNGISFDSPRLYAIRGIRPGDRFLNGSDGFYENTVGDIYKQRGSQEQHATNNGDAGVALGLPQLTAPTQDMFRTLNLLMAATASDVQAASELHDSAQFNIDNDPGQTITVSGVEIPLSPKRDKDNIFALSYEHGQAPAVEVRFPNTYRPLEAVTDPQPATVRATLGITVSQNFALQKQAKKDVVTIGRNSGSDFLIKDDSISKRHVAVAFDSQNGAWVIRDLDSANGTWVDQSRLSPQTWHSLPHGSVLRLGGAFFRVAYDANGALTLARFSVPQA